VHESRGSPVDELAEFSDRDQENWRDDQRERNPDPVWRSRPLHGWFCMGLAVKLLFWITLDAFSPSLRANVKAQQCFT
jgi:hypothetical protein